MSSIDGTDISDVTVDGEPVREVTVDGTVVYEVAKLFHTADSWSTYGDPTVDKHTGEMLGLASDSNSNNERRISFSFSGTTKTYSFDYTLIQEPPPEFAEDREHIILALRDDENNFLFTVCAVGPELSVYDPTDTNQGYQDQRSKTYNTGINLTELNTFEISWDGSAWNVDINNGQYTRTMDGMNVPAKKMEMGYPGTTDTYLSGRHEFDLIDTSSY